jgi:hypothetical protein
MIKISTEKNIEMEELISGDLLQIIFLIIIGLTSLFKMVSDWLKDKKKKPDYNIDININNKVYQILTECRVIFKADRAVVWQYHNGDFYISSNSILKQSITYESTDQRTIAIMRDYQNVLASQFPQSSNRLLNEGEIVIDNMNECDMRELREEMIYNGIKSMYMLKMTDKQNNMIGFLSLHYIGNENPNLNIDELKVYSNRITTTILKKNS